MRLVCILLLLLGGSALQGEQLLKLASGGDILVRKEGNRLVDCRGKEVTAKGSLVSTNERCPDPFFAVTTLPKTASNLTTLMLVGISLAIASLILRLVVRRKSRIGKSSATRISD